MRAASVRAGRIERALRNERRVRAVDDLGMFGTPPEEVFDRLTRLAVRVLHTPIGALTLLDAERQYFKSQIGLPPGIAAARQTPAAESFCRRVVAADAPVAIEDARADELLRSSPLVSDHGWISYAGVPVRASGGYVVGGLCVADHAARVWHSEDLELLTELASIATAELAVRGRGGLLERIRFGEVPAPMWVFEHATRRILAVNSAAVRHYGFTREEFLGMTVDQLRPREEVPLLLERLAASRGGFEPVGAARHVMKSGRVIDVEIASHDVMLDGRRCWVVIALDVTEQRKAQRQQQLALEALRESEARFRALFEAAGVGVAVLDSEARILTCNSALRRMLGRSDPELVTASLHTFAHPEDQDEVRQQLQQLAGGAADHVQLAARIICADGAMRSARANVSLIPDFSAGPRMISVVEDVTEEKRLEEEKQHRESYFRSLIENAKDIVWIFAPDGTVLYASPAVERVLGHAPGELIGANGMTLIHPDDLGTAIELLRVLGECGATGSMAVRLRHKDGSWRFIESTGRNLVDDPAVRGIVANSRDVTEQRTSEARLRHVAASSPSVLFTMGLKDGAMTDVWVSDSLKVMLGYTSADVRSLDWWIDNLHPDDRPSVLGAIDAMFRTGVFSHEHRFRCSDGSYRWVRAQAKVVRDPDGTPIELVGSWSDATEFRELETQLRHAQKMEAVGRLAGGIAHDFNNILTAISGHTELVLADLPAHDPLRADMDEIRKSSDRAASLTRQLLAFSRKQVLRPELLDLGTVVTDMERMLRRVLTEEIELETAAPAGLGYVEADRGQLEQVLLNLAVNARDAMTGCGRLRIDLRNLTLTRPTTHDHVQLPAGEYIVLAVHDTGSGIPPDVLPRIFEPFFTTKEAGKGTGLGLATVYGIVRQSGGCVRVRTEVGRGTSFEIQLPIASTSPGEAPARSVERARHGTETIMLVEDEAPVRELANRLLRRYGYTVIEAANGGEALLLGRTRAGSIDLLLTDVVMPHMSGKELADEMRRLNPGMKVLFMSGYPGEAVAGKGVLEIGAPLLQKPFTATSIARIVRETLDAGQHPPSLEMTS
jgi:PAS domain S-box-containing protein